jgi:hypothetical protein
VNSWSSCLSLPSAGIIGVIYYIHFKVPFGVEYFSILHTNLCILYHIFNKPQWYEKAAIFFIVFKVFY